MTQVSHLEGKGVGAVTAPHWLRQLGRDSAHTLTILPLAVPAVVLVATLVSVGIGPAPRWPTPSTSRPTRPTVSSGN